MDAEDGPEYDEEEEDISPDLWQEACWIVIRCPGTPHTPHTPHTTHIHHTTPMHTHHTSKLLL